MKIPLRMGADHPTTSTGQPKISEGDILAAARGDWAAKGNLARAFNPLLTTLAGRRTSETARINLYIDAGKQGLYKAAKKYKPTVGAARFQVFALDYIETAMNHLDKEKKGGFLSRLFGKG